jgi:hypothetical protein
MLKRYRNKIIDFFSNNKQQHTNLENNKQPREFEPPSGFVQVYRTQTFDPEKCYSTGLYDIKRGDFQKEKYYIDQDHLKYVGKYVTETKRGNNGHDSAFTYYFDDNGTENKVELDYEGKRCFKEVECTPKLGGKRHRKNKKTKKQKNKKTKKQKNKKKKNQKTLNSTSIKIIIFIFLPKSRQENK